jgi:hypothetical protein
MKWKSLAVHTAGRHQINWSRRLLRAWVLGSTLWLVGWCAHLLLEWPPAEMAGCDAVKHKGPTEPLADDQVRCYALLRWDDVFTFQADNCFVLTQSYIETFVENAALDIKPDRTLMLRYERKNLCQYGYRTHPLRGTPFYVGHPFYSIDPQENVHNHIVANAVAAFGLPAISFVFLMLLNWQGQKLGYW